MFKNINEANRQAWLAKTLAALPAGARLLDAGTGELRNHAHCQYLEYLPQLFCQYTWGDGGVSGLSSKHWDTSRIDLVSDITSMPEPDKIFDAILCSEDLDHVPQPTHALYGFQRLLKPSGQLILTATFGSNKYMAPYHFCSVFPRYWYEHHLPLRGFTIPELSANGDWHALLRQEISRLGGMERQRGNWFWPLAYGDALLGMAYFKLRKPQIADDLGYFN